MPTEMCVEEVVRLAWQAESEGRTGMCDALLTLAIAEGDFDDPVSAERFRRHLISRRPDHWLASFATVGQAVGHPRVVAALERLRASYPPVRVKRLLLRGEASHGPFRQRRPLSRVINDLLRAPAQVDLGPAGPSLAPDPVSTVAPLLAGDEGKAAGSDDPESILVYYLSVLLVIAILLACVLPPSARDATKVA